MKTACTLLLSLLALALPGCTKEEPSVVPAFKTQEQIITSEIVRISSVDFVNSIKRSAVTRVFVSDNTGHSSVPYYFAGYRPEITRGLKAERLYIHQKYGTMVTDERYVTRLCVKTEKTEGFLVNGVRVEIVLCTDL